MLKHCRSTLIIEEFDFNDKHDKHHYAILLYEVDSENEVEDISPGRCWLTHARSLPANSLSFARHLSIKFGLYTAETALTLFPELPPIFQSSPPSRWCRPWAAYAPGPLVRSVASFRNLQRLRIKPSVTRALGVRVQCVVAWYSNDLAVNILRLSERATSGRSGSSNTRCIPTPRVYASWSVAFFMAMPAAFDYFRRTSSSSSRIL
ncbi:hypothetical protein HGRIS_011924 [Hohenbuehelia grisea]|uniref:Uncharacterized protein n=1 Tax=Hohenbuehelia grisea TaxID=104357 RepID=A0ABR3JWR1_9AGAR